MRFALVNGIQPWVEVMPLHNAEQPVQKVEAGDARFRIVLEALKIGSHFSSKSYMYWRRERTQDVS